MSNEDIKMSDVKPCPFCNGNASMTQTGENFVIVRCLTIYCQPHPSAICYKKSDGEYDFYPWNNRHDNPMALRIKELEGAIGEYKASPTTGNQHKMFDLLMGSK